MVAEKLPGNSTWLAFAEVPSFICAAGIKGQELMREKKPKWFTHLGLHLAEQAGFEPAVGY